MNNFMKEKNRGLFLGLAWLGNLLVIIMMAGILFLVAPRVSDFTPWAFYVLLGIFSLIAIVLFGGLLLITLSAMTGIDMLYPHGGFQITMKVLPPIVLSLGKLLGFDKDRLLESFISVQNSIFIVQRRRVSADKVLLLLPHCLQHHDCPHKITWKVENCKKCGKCPIGNLYKLAEEFNIDIYIATGGTVARRVVYEVRPTVILAVACPRDLASGMVDVYPLPVYGILNTRPNGPCFDTQIDSETVRRVLEALNE